MAESSRAFCSPFDEALAHRGPGAVFRLDREGLLRFDAEWTRDAWGRLTDLAEPASVTRGWCWVLARDRGTGFVQLVLSTAPRLLATHPRLDLRAYGDAGEAEAALLALGRPPISETSW